MYDCARGLHIDVLRHTLIYSHVCMYVCMEIPGRDALKRVAEQAILELKTQQLSQDTNADSPKVPYFILSINFILKFLRLYIIHMYVLRP